MATAIPTMRITNGNKYLLMGVGFFFDLLPILVLVGGAALMFAGMTEFTSCIEAATSGGVVSKAKCVFAVARGGAAAVAIGAGLVMVGPLLYIILAWVTTLAALCVFTVWFYFGHNVNIWETKGSRLFANLLTGLIEMIPVINLLPGITLWVWRHATVTQMKDKVAIALAKSNAASELMGRRMQNAQMAGVSGRTSARRTEGRATQKRGVYPQTQAQQPSNAMYTKVRPTNRDTSGIQNVNTATRRGTAADPVRSRPHLRNTPPSSRDTFIPVQQSL